MDWRSLSPIGCPSESLMCLKPSRSRNSTATCFVWRGAKAIAWLIRSFRSIRFGRPVRKSCWAEWVICSAIARAALTSRNTITAPVACPSRSWIGATESSIGISWPSRRMRMQFDGRCTVRSWPTAIAIGFGVVSRLVASRIRNTSAIGRPAASSARPARHALRDEVQEGDVARDVRADDGVADAVERDLGALLLDEQRLFHDLALDGVAQRTQQPARLDLALDQIVLRAFLQRLGGQRLVVQAGQHHQGNARRGGVRPPHRLQPLRVGQSQVEQDDVGRRARRDASRRRACVST